MTEATSTGPIRSGRSVTAKMKQTTIYRTIVRRSFGMRRVLGRLIPDSLSTRARAAFGMLSVRELDFSRLSLIRAATMDQLRDVKHLETELLLELGLSADAPAVFPASFQPYLGVGLEHWQYPIQFAKYLSYIANLGVRSYLEIGVQHGGTFAITVEYLRRFVPLGRACAVDINRVPSLRGYERRNGFVKVLREDSSSARFREFLRRSGPFDLVLIDGDHAKVACRRDFESVRPYARMIAFHDITDSAWPGVGETWRELKRQEAGNYTFHEFTEQYAEVMEKMGSPALGIGLAVRNDPRMGMVS